MQRPTRVCEMRVPFKVRMDPLPPSSTFKNCQSCAEGHARRDLGSRESERLQTGTLIHQTTDNLFHKSASLTSHYHYHSRHLRQIDRAPPLTCFPLYIHPMLLLPLTVTGVYYGNLHFIYVYHFTIASQLKLS
jgi:hypothetical protein